MPRFISGRSKITPQTGLTSDRYQYLSVSDSEPNLGDPIVGPSSYIGQGSIPVGQQYIVVSIDGQDPGNRFWIPNQGGIIPGSISIFEEGILVGGLSSTTQLNFIGQAITAEGVGGATPGVAVTITVAPPGNPNEVLFVSAGSTDFATDTRFIFDDGLLKAGDRITVGTGGTVITTTGIGSVGIGTTQPTENLHLEGDFRITGTIYDSNNQPGGTGDLITKTASGGLLWVTPSSVNSGAGGTIGQIQFHNTAGLVDGADNFYFDFNNNRVGIGSTQPKQLLDVLGVSTFKGGVFVDELTATGITNIFNDLYLLRTQGSNQTRTLTIGGARNLSNNFSAINFRNYDSNSSAVDYTAARIVGGVPTGGVDGGELMFFTTPNSSTTNSEKVRITGDGKVGINETNPDETLHVVGTSTVTGNSFVGGNLNVAEDIVGKNLNITGIGTIATFDFGVGDFDAITVSGISTLGNVIVEGNAIKTKSGTGNLTLDSDGSSNIVVNDILFVSKNTQSTGKDSGSIVTEGGIGVEKSVFIGLNLDVDGDTELDGLNVDGFTSLDTLNVSVASTIASLTLNNVGIAVTAILDEDDMVSDRDDALATQQSIKKYVDDNITLQDLDFAGDSGTGSVDLDSQTFTIAGTANEIETSANNQTLTIGLPDDVTIAGSLTVNGDTDLGNANTDKISIIGDVDTNILPSTNGTLDLGASGSKWDNVYANTFIGAMTGNADSATEIETGSTSTNSTHYLTFVDSNNSVRGNELLYTDAGISYNPSTNDLTITGVITATGIGSHTFGNGNQRISLDPGGNDAMLHILTSNGDHDGILLDMDDDQGGNNFYALNIRLSDSPQGHTDNTNTKFLVNAEGNLLINRGVLLDTNYWLDVNGNTRLDGSVDLGNSNSDLISIIGDVDTNILPSTNGTLDLGASGSKWDNVYANTFIGAITGNAETATKLETARNFRITGDGDAPNVSFDGTSNVNLVLTLDTVNLDPGTFGDSTTVPQIIVNEKGLVTGVTSVAIDFGNANVATADSLTNSRNIAATGDIAWDVDFKGHENVTSSATLASIITPGDVGSSTQVGVVTFDAKGRITDASNIPINFSTATVAQSDTVKVTQRDTNAEHYLTFISNDASGNYENIYGDDHLQYNPNSNDLSTSGDIVSGRGSGGAALTRNDGKGNANVTFNHQNGTPEQNGNAARIEVNTDRDNNNDVYMDFELLSNVTSGVNVALTRVARINEGGIDPGSTGTFDLGSSSLRWDTIYANSIDGVLTGTVTNAQKIETKSIDTDATHYLTFVDGNNGSATPENLYTDAGITYNPSKDLLSIVKYKGNPYDAVPAYSNSDYDSIKWNTVESAIELQSDTDNAIGMAFPAFRCNTNSGEKFKISVQLRASATSSNGVFVRLYEYNAELPNGKTHVSHDPTNSVVQQSSQLKALSPTYNNQAGNTSWQTLTFDYTPSSNAVWASVVVLNWSGLGFNSLYIRDYKRESVLTDLIISDGTVGLATNLKGGAAGWLPYQSAEDTTTFLEEPNANGRVLAYNNGTNAPIWRALKLEAEDDGADAKLKLSDGVVDFDEVTITAGSNITIDSVVAGGFTIAAVAGAGLGVDATADDVLNVNTAEIGGVDAGADKIVFWDNSAGPSNNGKLRYLTVGTGLDITDTTITATSDAGKTYDISVVQTDGNNDNPAIRLSDGSTNDDITVVGGANITITRNNSSQFTIAAVAGAGIGVDETVDDVLGVSNGEITGVDPNDDRIVFWDNSAGPGNNGKLRYLDIGDNLSISGTTLNATTTSGDATLTVKDEGSTVGSAGGINEINFVGNQITATGSSNVATVTVSDVTVDQTSYTGTNPITVTNGNEINIPDTSNAYGRRYVQATEPTGGKVGDIWYDTSGASSDAISVPVGGIIMWTGTTLPSSNWALCDGNNGTPDLRNRFVVASNDMGKTGITTQSGPVLNGNTGGLGALGGATYEPGDVGGDHGVQLTVDELAEHNHSYSKFSAQETAGGGGGGQAGNNENKTTGDAGGNKYHENRPPYYALAFIMRIN